MNRVIAYIDGFNLYYGIRSKRWRRYYWLDVQKLARSLLKRDQELVLTKYFTARVSYPPDKYLRQKTYLEALETLSGVRVLFGRYQLNPTKCRKCSFEDQIPSEKMTDVNIAVELLGDAFDDAFDTALLVSADADLVRAVSAVNSRFPAKRVIVAFPPARTSLHLRRVANGEYAIGRDKLKESQFPDSIVKADGFVLRRPPEWH